jgi:hypothetical protein
MVGDARPDEECAMTQYLLSVHGAADGGAPPAGPMTQERFEHVLALQDEMKAAGAWLFGGRLTDPAMATVVQASTGDVLTTDGPFAESKEHLAGFYLIEADDLDAALGWATKTSAVIGKPIEVRPFWDDHEA